MFGPFAHNEGIYDFLSSLLNNYEYTENESNLLRSLLQLLALQFTDTNDEMDMSLPK
jgi:hypothetical protein